jgi:hypothetical protein
MRVLGQRLGLAPDLKARDVENVAGLASVANSRRNCIQFWDLSADTFRAVHRS